MLFGPGVTVQTNPNPSSAINQPTAGPYAGGLARVLYDPAVTIDVAEPLDSVRAWKPPVEGVREVLHARHVEHAYPVHTHDVWTLLLVDQGAIRYDLDRRAHGAEPTMVSILPPHVVHDGRPATSDGYRKRVIYLEPAVVGESLIGSAVDRPVLPDPGLRRAVSALDDALGCIDDAFEAETRLHLVAERIRRVMGGSAANQSERAVPHATDAAVEAFRAYLDAHLFDPVTIAAAAEALRVGPTHLARGFRATFGIAPHAYVVSRRLEVARDRILAGQPLADVATEVGFFDQAHLTRRFKRFLGVTPGRFPGG
jgi:AraC-like DNA-binding protein